MFSLAALSIRGSVCVTNLHLCGNRRMNWTVTWGVTAAWSLGLFFISISPAVQKDSESRCFKVSYVLCMCVCVHEWVSETPVGTVDHLNCFAVVQGWYAAYFYECACTLFWPSWIKFMLLWLSNSMYLCTVHCSYLSLIAISADFSLVNSYKHSNNAESLFLKPALKSGRV